MERERLASSSDISLGIESVSYNADKAAATRVSRDSNVGVNSARGMSLSMVRVYMEGDALLPVGLLVKLGRLYSEFFWHVFYFLGGGVPI